MAACHEYVERTRRRMTIEYALIDGVNDGLEQARKLVRLLRGLDCHVNLIPLNPGPAAVYRASPRERVDAFQRVLTGQGLATTVRLRRGVEIQAGCGQLRQRYENRQTA
jgi:23S rRNA (adenine2503-C2)-methyltransferase